MTRLTSCFEKLKTENRKALVVFITAGDPDLDATKNILDVIDDSGADIIELGVPFSDPLADGPIIQASALRALKSGTTLRKILALVKDIRKNRGLPIVLMTSFNPVFVYGEKQFVEDAVSVGVDGVIVPDLPPEESIELSACAKKKGLDVIRQKREGYGGAVRDGFEYTNADYLLIFGAEDKGLRDLTKQKCDQIIKIPIKSNNIYGIESLNVTNACTIGLYEHFKINKK